MKPQTKAKNAQQGEEQGNKNETSLPVRSLLSQKSKGKKLQIIVPIEVSFSADFAL